MKHFFTKQIAVFLISSLFTIESYSQFNVVDTMPIPRSQFSMERWGDSIFFFGGWTGDSLTSRVDIFNIVTETWETPTNMSVAKCCIEAVAGDSALYVVGGVTDIMQPLDGTNLVEIYKDGVWTVDTLLGPIANSTGLHVGNKIIFAGGLKELNGGQTNIEIHPYVHIYDETTGIWDIDTMDVPRNAMGIASNDTIAIFAGGDDEYLSTSNRVDIYNSITDSWSTDTLSLSRRGIAGAYANGKFIFAGGSNQNLIYSSDVVDIYDGNSWTTDQLILPISNAKAAVTDSKIVIAGGGPFNLGFFSDTASLDYAHIYDIATETWGMEVLVEDRVRHEAIGYKNKVYVAGGNTVAPYSVLNSLEIREFSPVAGIFSEDLNQFSQEKKEKPVMYYDVLGRKTEPVPNKLLIAVYPDGSKKKIMIVQ